MCGIGGAFSQRKINLHFIKTIMDRQSHRGPDGEGYLIGNLHKKVLVNPLDLEKFYGHWAIGHKRLAIIDTSQQGNQPMGYANNNLWITYNGEIYNYKEIKKILSNLGHHFRTETDTEVILAAYLEWGVRSFEKFNGMWAMVIVDLFKSEVIFSRDRFGEKPLHYYKDETSLIFSSEIKGILPGLEKQKPSLNRKVTKDYVVWGVTNNTNKTFFNEIKSFPAASYAVFKIDSPGKWDIQKYWSLNLSNERSTSSFEEAKETFKNLFLDAVKLRLRSDVPIGFCLSGGLDSSSIVCSSKFLDELSKIETFTSISEYKAYDERQWANIINAFVKADSTFVDVSEDGFIADLEQLIWDQEEPFTTASIYAQWLLMKKVRNSNIPVVLDGQGADEILCGYRKFYLFYIQELFAKGNIFCAFKELLYLFINGDRNIFKISDGMKYMPAILSREKSNNGIINKEFFNLFSDVNSQVFNTIESVKTKQVNDLMGFSVPSLLRYEDRNAMAWSVESRVPFLDYRLVEFLLSLPNSYKMQRGRSKYILREAFGSFVPKSILNRRDKMGFMTAQELWMNNKLGDKIISRFNSKESIVKNWINIKKIKDGLHGRDSKNLIFRLYILDVWMEKFNVQF